MPDRALVLLSGGLDSATCLYWAKKRFSEVTAITYNYSGRIEGEKRAAAKLADRAGVSRIIEIDLPFVKEASDFFDGKQEQGGSGPWSSYIPARNMMFYSIAAYHAEFLGVKSIVGGHNMHDVEFFRDASKGYMEKMNALFKEGCLLCNGSMYKIALPLARMRRREIVKLAVRLHVPIELTWSCHNDGRAHCGNCYACRQRVEAFNSLGIRDPAFPA
ncbi:MAG: 7-cyano-7-deazaguanine synthase [Nitrososphaera sp.]